MMTRNKPKRDTWMVEKTPNKHYSWKP